MENKRIDIDDQESWSNLDWDDYVIPEVLKKSDASIARSRSNRLNKKGKKDSLETRAKKSAGKTGKAKPEHAEKLKGRKRPEYAKLMKGKQVGEKNGNSKTYVVTEPCGKSYEVTSLKNFAKSLNKPLVTAREMAAGKYPDNKSKTGAWAGWTIKFK